MRNKAGTVTIPPEKLPAVRAGVVEVALRAEFRREFGETVGRVHLDPVVLTAALIRLLEGAAVGRAGEGEDFVEAIAQAAQSAAGAIDRAVGPACLAAVVIGLADDLLGDFDE